MPTAEEVKTQVEYAESQAATAGKAQPLVVYTPKVEEIAALCAEVGLQVVDGKPVITALDFAQSAGYQSGVLAIAKCRNWRGQLEKDRKAANEDALRHQRAVNRLAQEVEAKILAVEEPLKAAKKAVDDEKERLAKEKAEAVEREQRAKIEAERKAQEEKQTEERRKLDEERAAFELEKKLNAEKQAAIEKRLDEERQRRADEARKLQEKIDADSAAKEAARRATVEAEQQRLRDELAAEQAKIAAERKALEEERIAAEKVKREAERAEFERTERIRIERETAERAEADRLAAIRRAEEEEKAKDAAEKRRVAMLDDAGKLLELAASLRLTLAASVASPRLKSKEAKEVVNAARLALSNHAALLEAFGKDGP